MISDVFHRLKFMERRGSGLKKIIKEYDPENLPEFYSDQQYFTVTLGNKNYGKRKTNQKTILETISNTENRILLLIRENPKISIDAISKKLGNITKSGVKYNLKKLKNKSIIKRIGADKGGYWKIINNSFKNED